MRLMISLLIFFLGISATFAKEFPCTPITFSIEQNQTTLPGASKQSPVQAYLFKNKSTDGIWIDHPDLKNKGVSAGWSSYIRPNNWSALVINKSNFAVSCALIKPGKVEYIDCRKVLEVCAPQQIILNKKINGNFWLAEDKDWDSLLRTLQRRGVFP